MRCGEVRDFDFEKLPYIKKVRMCRFLGKDFFALTTGEYERQASEIKFELTSSSEMERMIINNRGGVHASETVKSLKNLNLNQGEIYYTYMDNRGFAVYFEGTMSNEDLLA